MPKTLHRGKPAAVRYTALAILVSLVVCTLPAPVLGAALREASTVPGALVNHTQVAFAYWAKFFSAGRVRAKGMSQRQGTIRGKKPASPPSKADRESAVAAIQVNPSGDVILQSEQPMVFAAVPVDSHGSSVQGLVAEWTSNNPQVVFVNGNGEAVARRPGNAILTATAGQVREQVRVTVVEGSGEKFGGKKKENSRRPSSSAVNNADNAGGAKFARKADRKKRAHASRVNVGAAAPAFLRPINDDPLPDDETPTLFTPNNGVGNPPGRTTPGTLTPPTATDGTESPGSANFTFDVPVVSLPGRGIDLTLNMVYNSRTYNKSTAPFTGATWMTYDVDSGWPAAGFRLGFGQLEDQGTLGFSLIDHDGTRHLLAPTGVTNNYESEDGTFIHFTGGAGWGSVFYADGSRVDYGAAGGGIRSYPTKIVDRNGNYLLISYLNGVGPRISSIQDTLGRYVRFYYDSNNDLVVITAPGLTGEDDRQVLRFYYQDLTLSTSGLFASNINVNAPSSTRVIKYLYFPSSTEGNGAHLGYRYDYSAYGMIYQVAKLHGMTVSSTAIDSTGSVSTEGEQAALTTYNYPTTASALTDVPAYTRRTDDWAGRTTGMPSTGDAPFYTFSVDQTNGISSVKAPDDTVTETHFIVAANQWNNGLLSDTYVKQSPTGPVLLHTETSWEQDANGKNPRPYQLKMTNDAGQTTTTVLTYGAYNNVTVQSMRGFDNTEIRRVETDYQTGSAWINRHLLRLPTEVRVYAGGASSPSSRTTFSYDTAGANLTARSGLVMHDAAFDPASGSYDSATDKRGNVVSVTAYSDAAGSTGAITQTATYDIAGNVVTADADCCRQKSFTYSNTFYFAYRTGTTLGTSPTLSTSADFDFNTGLLASVTDENAQLTELFYHEDSLRPEHVDYSNGALVSYLYDDTLTADYAGRKHFYNATATKLDATRTITSYRFFDGRGQITQTFDRFTQANGWTTVDFEYDLMGRRYRSSNPYYTSGYGLSAINPSGLWTIQTFDNLGRVKRIDQPSGDAANPTSTFVTIDRTGVFTTTTDQAGKKRRQKVDALGRVIRLDEPDDSGNLGTETSPNRSTAYEYDILGNLIHVAQGDQHRYFRYDSLSRLTHDRQVEQDAPYSTTDSVAGNTQWSRKLLYNSHNQIENLYDARQLRTQYVYDGLNRVKEVHHFLANGDPDPATPDVFYRYDSESLPSSLSPAFDRGYSAGRLVAVTYGSNTSTTGSYFGYDQAGRVVRHRQVTGTNSYNLTYGYNLGGLLESETYPSGRTIAYSYDDGARLSQVSEGSTTYSSGFAYEPNGGLSSETWGNGAIHTMAYNRALQATEIKLKQSASGPELQRFNYSYGVVNPADGSVDTTKNNGQIGRIDSYIDGVKQWDQRFSYDALGRLSVAAEYKEGNNSQLTWQATYTFDRYGNRFQSGSGNSGFSYTPVLSSEIDAARNRFISTGSTPITYDAAGNIIEDFKFRGMRYSYNSRGQQTFAERDDHSNQQTSIYDGAGQRVQVTANGKTQQLVYDQFGQTVAEYGNGILERENIYRGGQLLLVAESGVSTVSVPTNLTTSPSGSNVVLNWTAASGAINYRVERKAAGASFVSVGMTSGTSFTDNGVSAGNAYLYRVCAADGSGNCNSGFSNSALGTVFSFDDPTITTIADDPTGQNVTPARAVHITQLRSAVNAVRSLAGLSSASWSTTVTAGGTISKDDIKDLRDRLNDAYTALAIPLPTYTDGTLVGAPNGTLIKGVHIRELRQNVTRAAGSVPCSKTIAQFVQDSFQGALGRQPNASELSYWTVALTQAQTQGVWQLLGAAQSLEAILFNSAEYNSTTHTNEQFVEDLYETYLHRASDSGGFAYWVNTLLGGASRTQVRQGFSDSVEFRENVFALCWVAVSNAGLRYVFSDLQGSTRALMNNNGAGSSAVVARHDYLPYGEEIWAGTGLRSSTQGFGAVDNSSRRYAFTDRDKTTGLDRMQWREYDNLAGRFTSPDPFGGSGRTDNPQSFNRYTYTMNDPVNAVDPSGLVTCFGYHVLLFHIVDGKVTGVEYLGFIPVFCWDDSPVEPRSGGPGGGTVGPQPAGQQNNHAKQRSSCQRFVDALVWEARTDRAFGRANVGRVLGGLVTGKNKLGDWGSASTTGFKQHLIDQQGGWALAHIMGMAGAFLIGNNPLIPKLTTQTGNDVIRERFNEDFGQLRDDMMANDQRGVRERISEINDDVAGLVVGAILGEVIDGKKSADDAKKEIFNLLCDF